MCQVLILDDDLYGAQTAKLVLESDSSTFADIATSAEEAKELVTRSIQKGKPYEVFLIDQQLGAGENGIEVMKGLRSISPDAETIIFTGYGDSENGLNAYRAGAFRYLAKPYDNQELLFLIEALREWQKARQEHGWQKIFSEMMEAALQQRNFQAVSDVVVNYSLKLGFERAHLFWIPTREDANRNNQFVGVACAGRNCISNFPTRFFPLTDWYDFDNLIQIRNAVFTRGVPSEMLNDQMKAFGYEPPLLEVAFLPLWRGNNLIGVLVLDYDQLQRTASELERSLLNLFSRQVSVVLNQASMYGHEQWMLHESSIIQNIGRQIITTAASVNLVDLLEEIRRQVAQLMDVSNFAVILLDGETNELDFHLLYEIGRRRKGIRRSVNHGFEEYLLTHEKEILLSGNVEEFIREHHIEFTGEIPSSWLGVPLRIGNRVIGGIVVYQRNAQGNAYRESDKRILLSVADQVAGAIQISWYSEAEKEDARRMQLLQKASVEMLRIVRENEDHFWLTVLTIATANFGLGFNRALLFLAEENNRRLHGRMGIGAEKKDEANRDWERDEKRRYDFQTFLADLGTRRMHHTPFENLVKQVDIELSDTQDVISKVINQKERVIVQTGEDGSLSLPVELTRHFSLATCALLPLRAGNNILGVVIVDNKHNRRPLKDPALDRLQTLLDHAGLVWETRREQKKSTTLLDANYDILSGAKDQLLRETLKIICKTARAFSHADWAVIFPMRKSDPQQFDLDNIGFDGELRTPLVEMFKEAPHVGGVSSYVLKKQTLVIGNIDIDNAKTRRLNLSEHHFIKSEGVKALIGAVIHNKNSEEPLGLLYLDYRRPQSFSVLERSQALSFASLAGVAISNSRRIDELRQRRQLKTAKEIAETIGTGLDLEKTMEAILQKLHEVFEKTRLCVLLYQKDLKALKFAPATLKFYKIQNPEYRKQDTFPLDRGSIACRVARQALRTKNVVWDNIIDIREDDDYLPLNPKILSELCISLLSTKDDLLGVLVLERDRVYGFNDGDVELVQIVAQQLSIAIERAQQSEELDFKSVVAAQTTWAADIAHEINNEVGQIRNWAYLLKNNLGEGTVLQEYAQKIEESAAALSGAGPWSDQPQQIIELDPALEHYLQNIAQQTDLFIDIRLGAPSINIRVNIMELQRVLRHLVRNAVRAMSNSEIKRLIVVTLPLDENTVEILFQDFGPGISKDVRLSVFQRPLITKGRGGYGLLLVRQMLEDMNGHIKLLPYRRSQGATFSIQFPVAVLTDHAVE
jgi:GAF domain-containing protein/ActR/RegA family two-component response regulator